MFIHNQFLVLDYNPSLLVSMCSSPTHPMFFLNTHLVHIILMSIGRGLGDTLDFIQIDEYPLALS